MDRKFPSPAFAAELIQKSTTSQASVAVASAHSSNSVHGDRADAQPAQKRLCSWNVGCIGRHLDHADADTKPGLERPANAAKGLNKTSWLAGDWIVHFLSGAVNRKRQVHSFFHQGMPQFPRQVRAIGEYFHSLKADRPGLP
jgi:hypothetical protein